MERGLLFGLVEGSRVFGCGSEGSCGMMRVHRSVVVGECGELGAGGCCGCRKIKTDVDPDHKGVGNG